MKKTVILFVCLLFATVALAQNPRGPRGGKDHAPSQDVIEMVSDLSATQKKKLESISTESKKRVDKMQNELKALRGKIRQLMQADGDNSAVLFPLLDKESSLQAEIAKEMYRTRLLFDQVLTPDQLKELRAKFESERKKHPHHGPGDRH